MKILWMSWGAELLMHTHVNDGFGQRHISHSLQISDPGIFSLSGLFVEELQNTRLGEQNAAQAILLAMMLRLQKNCVQTLRKSPTRRVRRCLCRRHFRQEIPREQFAGKLLFLSRCICMNHYLCLPLRKKRIFRPRTSIGFFNVFTEFP
jgi:hypothetical protein